MVVRMILHTTDKEINYEYHSKDFHFDWKKKEKKGGGGGGKGREKGKKDTQTFMYSIIKNYDHKSFDI